MIFALSHGFRKPSIEKAAGAYCRRHLLELQKRAFGDFESPMRCSLETTDSVGMTEELDRASGQRFPSRFAFLDLEHSIAAEYGGNMFANNLLQMELAARHASGRRVLRMCIVWISGPHPPRANLEDGPAAGSPPTKTCIQHGKASDTF
jgi:hypothetical protein